MKKQKVKIIKDFIFLTFIRKKAVGSWPKNLKPHQLLEFIAEIVKY